MLLPLPLFCLLLWLGLLAGATSASSIVKAGNHSLTLDGKDFFIRGVNYSPVPISESSNWAPYGDYFTSTYLYIWQRDFPLIKAMGANVIRIYSWDTSTDHSDFLDVVNAAGLKVIVNYYIDNDETPVETEASTIASDFASEVYKYAGHPAIAAWVIGNEVNGDWNGYLQGFSDANSCGWTSSCVSSQTSSCQTINKCVYTALFTWLNDCASQAKDKAGSDAPVIGVSFADTDTIVASGSAAKDKIYLYGSVLTSVDLIGVSLYRGVSFGNYFKYYNYSTDKLLFVSEYGVDAYNDPCGWAEAADGVCTNLAFDGTGGVYSINGEFDGCSESDNPDIDCTVPGEESQASYDLALATELEKNSFTNGGVVAGGMLMEWHDEYWKGSNTNLVCTAKTCTIDASDAQASLDKCLNDSAYAVNGSNGCSSKAHISCDNEDASYHDLCGNWNGGSPDNYVNEEFFGLTEPALCNLSDSDGGHTLVYLSPRSVSSSLISLWSGNSSAFKFPSCSEMHDCWSCSISSSDSVSSCNASCSILSYLVHVSTPIDNETTTSGASPLKDFGLVPVLLAFLSIFLVTRL